MTVLKVLANHHIKDTVCHHFEITRLAHSLSFALYRRRSQLSPRRTSEGEPIDLGALGANLADANAQYCRRHNSNDSK